MRVTTVRFREEEHEELSDLARFLRKEKSEILREALTIGLAEIRIRLAAEAYSEGRISIGRAAEMAKLGLLEFHHQLKRRGIVVKYGKERFEEELRKLGLS